MNTILWASRAIMVFAMLAQPAQADELEDALQMALEAYQAGDINTAKEEIDYAAQLIAQMKAVGLSEFLPEATGFSVIASGSLRSGPVRHTSERTSRHRQDRPAAQSTTN